MLLAVPLIAVGIGLRLRRLTETSLFGAAILGLLWLTTLMAVEAGYADASMDCWRQGCSSERDATVVVIFASPVAIGFLMIVVLVSAIVDYVRRRGGHLSREAN
jgi:hypothetical protein